MFAVLTSFTRTTSLDEDRIRTMLATDFDIALSRHDHSGNVLKNSDSQAVCILYGIPQELQRSPDTLDELMIRVGEQIKKLTGLHAVIVRDGKRERPPEPVTALAV